MKRLLIPLYPPNQRNPLPSAARFGFLSSGSSSVLRERGIHLVCPSMNPAGEVVDAPEAGGLELPNGAAAAGAGATDDHCLARAIERRQRFGQAPERDQRHVRDPRDVE